MRSTRRNTGSLQPDELKVIYAVSRVVAGEIEIDKALAEIVRLSRPVFIFDNAVLYLQNEEKDGLEAAFARAIGRGKSSKADNSWGIKAAQAAFSSGEIFRQEAEISGESDRLEQAFYLGLPLIEGGNLIGALVFVRFGGPSFTDPQINLAEFIAAHVTQVLEHRRLVSRVASLEADKRLAQLQSDFLATVSHELKTPLGFIKGYSSTLLRENTNWSVDERHEFLSIIEDESNHMSDLVDNLLDSSRLQSGTLELHLTPFNILQSLHELIERVKIHFPDLEIVLEKQEEEIEAFGDANRISQVFENIIGNSIKYAPGSTIRILVNENEDSVEVQISDEGPGISAEHLGNIFKRFYRVPDENRKVRGSGLGLYISKQIVHNHHGEISVRSEIGKGTQFNIHLPKPGKAQIMRESEQ